MISYCDWNNEFTVWSWNPQIFSNHGFSAYLEFKVADLQGDITRCKMCGHHKTGKCVYKIPRLV